MKKIVSAFFFVCIASATCDSKVFHLQSLDASGVAYERDLLSVSIDRIKEKQEIWRDIFDDQEAKRLLTYLGLSAAIGGVSLCLAAPYLWPEKKTNGDSSSISPEQLKAKRADAFQRAQTDYYNHINRSATFWGMLQKQTSNGAALAIGSAFVGFFSYLFSSSGKYFKEKIKRGFGFGESEVFAELVREVCLSGDRLKRSLSSFIEVCENDTKRKSKSIKLRACLSSGIAIDHYAFVTSLEMWAAFIFEFLNQKNLNDEIKKEIFNALVMLLSFFEEFIQKEKSMYGAYMLNKPQKIHMSHDDFLASMENLCLEVCRVSQRVGVFYYGAGFASKKLRSC